MRYCTCGSNLFESPSGGLQAYVPLSADDAASYLKRTIPVAARSKSWVRGRTSAAIVGSNPTGVMDICLV
jgi:hypothetical protein